jgi:hypothetical protein
MEDPKEKGVTLRVQSAEHIHVADSIKLKEVVEYVETKNRILVALIILNLIWAFVSPLLPYWYSVSFSIGVTIIGLILGYLSFMKVREFGN